MSEFEENTEVEEKINVEELINVGELRPHLKNVNLKVRCKSKYEEREGISRKTGESYRVTEALVGDHTGSILLTLWNTDIDRIDIDQIYLLTNVYTSIFRGSLHLNIGRYGTIELIDEDMPSEVNEENNLSNEIYAQPERHRPRYGGYNSYPNKPRRENWKSSWSNRRRKRRY